MSLELGRFQLEGLVMNRVPFVFLAQSHLELKQLFSVVDMVHVRTCLNPLSAAHHEPLLSQSFRVFEERKSPLNQPIVILMELASHAKDLADQLTGVGYTNVCFINSDFKMLLEESKDAGPL